MEPSFEATFLQASSNLQILWYFLRAFVTSGLSSGTMAVDLRGEQFDIEVEGDPPAVQADGDLFGTPSVVITKAKELLPVLLPPTSLR